jgi:hypothetical protein
MKSSIYGGNQCKYRFKSRMAAPAVLIDLFLGFTHPLEVNYGVRALNKPQ